MIRHLTNKAKTPPPPQTRLDLDLEFAGSKCNTPGCNCGGTGETEQAHIVCSDCKGEATMRAVVLLKQGILELYCAKCGHGLDRFLIAKLPD